jgi:hypothetical protein
MQHLSGGHVATDEAVEELGACNTCVEEWAALGVRESHSQNLPPARGGMCGVR